MATIYLILNVLTWNVICGNHGMQSRSQARLKKQLCFWKRPFNLFVRPFIRSSLRAPVRPLKLPHICRYTVYRIEFKCVICRESTHYGIPQAWWTFGHAPLNSRRFLAFDRPNSFRALISRQLIGLSCNLVLEFITLQRRHNARDGVSNHQPHDCLLNCLFRDRSKKTSKLRVIGLWAGNSPLTGEFPAQRPATRKMFPIDGIIMMSKLMIS